MKTKKKNQNKIIKIASALMILCLMTTCAISATFAKYATTDSTEDTARVAKWGVVLSASGTLFGKNYAANTATSNSDAIIAALTSHSASTHSVVANDKVVAPGTKNDVGVQLKLNGKPEVAYSVAASTTPDDLKDIYLEAGTYGVMVVAYGLNAETDITQYYVLEGTSYKPATGEYDASKIYYKLLDKVVLGADYYPVVWSLSKNNEAATEYNNVTALTDAIRTDVNGTTTTGEGNDAVTTINSKRDYDANHELNDTYKITWAWGFENGENNNKADTILGNIGYTTVVELGEDGTSYSAISADSYSLNVAFNITISAAQID